MHIFLVKNVLRNDMMVNFSLRMLSNRRGEWLHTSSVFIYIGKVVLSLKSLI